MSSLLETSGADVPLGSFNQSRHPGCPVQNLGLGVSSNYVECNKNYKFKKKITGNRLFYFYISCVQTCKQLAQAYEIWQQFPKVVGKIGIFVRHKPSQDSTKSRLKTSWIQFFLWGDTQSPAPHKSLLALHGRTTFQKPTMALYFT